jgi:drug/metabolite transporter (DMT)-like permease
LAPGDHDYVLRLALAVAMTPPAEGANIGAGLVGLLALLLSVLAAVLLIRGSDSTPPRAAGGASIALFVGYFLLAGNYAADGVLIGLLLAAIAALCTSVVLVVTSRRRPLP